jgi:hypothetical protein
VRAAICAGLAGAKQEGSAGDLSAVAQQHTKEHRVSEAQELKALAKEAIDLKATHIVTRDRLDRLLADERKKELFAAIDAQQSIIDEQRCTINAMQAEIEQLRGLGEEVAHQAAEIERLTKDAERFKANDKSNARSNAELIQKAWYAIGADLAGLKWSDFVAAIAAGSPAELTPADACGNE